jgi:hypothetical protein
VRIHRAREQRLQLEAVEIAFELVELRLGLGQGGLLVGGVGLLLGELEEDADFLDLPDQRVERIQLRADRIGLVDDALGPEVVVPEGGREGLRLQFLEFTSFGIDVKDSLAFPGGCFGPGSGAVSSLRSLRRLRLVGFQEDQSSTARP